MASKISHFFIKLDDGEVPKKEDCVS